MANALDEVTGPTNSNGRDVNVIDKQLPVTVGIESTLFEIALWTVGTIPGIIILATQSMPVLQALLVIALGVVPGILFAFMKINAVSYLNQLEQKIQADASQIDNYIEQRVVILENVVGLVNRSVKLDSEVMTAVAALRSGQAPGSANSRNQTSQQLDGVMSRLNVTFEAYPDLKAHSVIADAMRQNSYLQKEITAARTLYNDTVARWNQDIFAWPTKQIVAARKGKTTRIPFIASAEMKKAARSTFF